MNKYSSRVKFRLCTNDDEFSKKYDIPKLETEPAFDDIFLEGTDQVLSGKETVVGTAYHDYNRSTLEVKDLKIIIRLPKSYGIWKSFGGSAGKSFVPHNWELYSFLVHETMHTMGIAHINDRVSIMNPVISFENGNYELNAADVKLLDDYNVKFYGAEPQNLLPPMTEITMESHIDFETPKYNITTNDEFSM